MLKQDSATVNHPTLAGSVISVPQVTTITLCVRSACNVIPEGLMKGSVMVILGSAFVR